MNGARRDGQVHGPRARAAVAAIVVAAASLGPGAARAQTPGELGRARQWFKEGEALEAKGDCAGAIGKFERALGVKETPQIRLRIGACQESTGRLVEARGSFERALAVAGAVANADAAAVARERLAALDARVPKLTITAEGAPPGTVVTLDGARLGADALGVARRVDPGEHVVRAEAPGYPGFERTVTLEERASSTVAVALALAPRPQPAPAAPAPAPAPARGGSVVPWVLVGGGAAAIAGGVVLWVVSAGKDGDIDAQCGGAERAACPLSRKDAIESDVASVNALRGASLAVGGVGVVAAGVGVALLVRSRGAAASGAGARVWPTAGAGALGAGVAGVF